MRKIRCPICEEKTYFKDRESLISHIAKKHKDVIPEGWEASRYENYLRTGKTAGTCMECKGPTGWNNSTNKYFRICKNPKCKKAVSDRAEQNMVKKTGMTKSQRMSQASVQTKMIYAKHTSGCYKENGHEIWYDSSYGKEFVDLLVFSNFDMSDVSGPSPNTYQYKYDGKTHIYIPDFCIHTYGLEVEIKDGGDNPNNHPKIQRVDKVKEQEKDKVMEKLQKEGNLRYIKIVNKDYREFFQLIMELKEQYDGDVSTTPVKVNGPVKETMSVVEDSIDITDVIFDLPNIMTTANNELNISGASKGHSATYTQIPKYYLEKIKTMEEKDVAFWEDRIILTLEQLRNRQKTDKSYDLAKTIRQMESNVLPALNKRIAELKRRKRV